MRRGAGDSYTLRLASDVYPNQPNVRRYHVTLDSALFDDPRFEVSDVGPFVLAIRKSDARRRLSRPLASKPVIRIAGAATTGPRVSSRSSPVYSVR